MSGLLRLLTRLFEKKALFLSQETPKFRVLVEMTQNSRLQEHLAVLWVIS
jgi:hypothetical protein